MEIFKFLIENPLYLIPIFIFIGIFVKSYITYITSSYYKITKNSYFGTYRDKGKYGEYLVYKHLKAMENNGAKFLFNLYIPKQNGETIEIDILMISPKGIFVFESKNYSGWIFGSENQRYWYQTLPNRFKMCHKEKFYNPVKQNISHIKALEKVLGVNIPIWSIIVFSERCTLKKIDITSNNVAVIKRYNLVRVISSIYSQNPVNLLGENEIGNIYKKLYPYTQVSESIKQQHIKNIRENTNDRKHHIRNTGFFEERSLRKDNKKCPWCSGELILRTATKGKNEGNQFYGCSNYPNCKYIKKFSTDSNVLNIGDEVDDFFG